MTKLEEVLAEAWEYGVRPHQAGNSVMWRRAGEHGTTGVATFTGPDRELRAAVAVLGKRALTLVLKHEFCGPELGDCPECGGVRPEVEMGGRESACAMELIAKHAGLVDESGHGHAPDCAWGAIVRAAKELG